MPRGDGTGPMGMGSMTGRAAGYCAGYATPGFMNPVGGRMGRGMAWGRGMGWGRGRGMGRWGVPMTSYYAPPTYAQFPYGPGPAPEQELEILQSQAKIMGEQLKEIHKRISDLEQASPAKEK